MELLNIRRTGSFSDGFVSDPLTKEVGVPLGQWM